MPRDVPPGLEGRMPRSNEGVDSISNPPVTDRRRNGLARALSDEHAQVRGGMNRWGGGDPRYQQGHEQGHGRAGFHYYGPTQTPGAGPSSAPANHAPLAHGGHFYPPHLQQAMPALQTQPATPISPWHIGATQIASHVPPLAQQIDGLTRGPLNAALNPGNRPVSAVSERQSADGVVQRSFSIQMYPGTVPLRVTATVRHGVLQQIDLNPPRRTIRFEASAPVVLHAPGNPMASGSGYPGHAVIPGGGQVVPYDSRRTLMPMSERHRALEERDFAPYMQLRNDYPEYFRGGDIHRLQETNAFAFRDVVDVGMDDCQVITGGNGLHIGTDGLGPCIAICARGVTGSGETVLGVYHYSGAGATPAEAMHEIDTQMREKGAHDIGYMFVGGMIMPIDSDSGSYENELGLLALGDQYRIEGARLHLCHGDHDADGMTNSTAVVLTPDGVFFRSNAMYPYAPQPE